eukprot:scaffold7033_cov36-Phaeocystis_antarctica.AAC.1
MPRRASAQVTRGRWQGHAQRARQGGALFDPNPNPNRVIPVILTAPGHVRLQPGSHTVAAWFTYGCSLAYIRLQPRSHTVAGALPRDPHGRGEGDRAQDRARLRPGERA